MYDEVNNICQDNNNILSKEETIRTTQDDQS